MWLRSWYWVMLCDYGFHFVWPSFWYWVILWLYFRVYDTTPNIALCHYPIGYCLWILPPAIAPHISGSQTVRGAAASSQGSRELLQFFTILSFVDNFISIRWCRYSAIYNTFWFHMLIWGAITCCVYDNFGTRLHATKWIDTPLKFLENAHPSTVSKSVTT